jgi:hypothetical protein
MLLLWVEACFDGRVYQRVADLAADCAAHRVTVQRAVSRLAQQGLIPAGGLPKNRGDVRWDLLAAMIGSVRPALVDSAG